MAVDGCVCANCEAERHNFIGLRGPRQFIYTGSNTMAPPPQLPPVDRARYYNDASYHAWWVNAANMHMEMRRHRSQSELEQKVPPVIGIEHTSSHIEKIDGEGYALYQRILDDPHDLAPRLIYADWLREHGDEERADFIQWMIELKDFDVHAPASPPRFKYNDCRKLLENNLVTWHGLHKHIVGSLYGGTSDLPYGSVDLHWRNGFVDSVHIYGPYTEFSPRSLVGLIKVHPLRAVNFSAFAGDKDHLDALSNIVINRVRTMAGLTPLKEHSNAVFNFKIDDPWFNPVTRERFTYYRYPTGMRAMLADRTMLHNWVQSAMQPIRRDWVQDQLGILPFTYTDDKKEGE